MIDKTPFPISEHIEQLRLRLEHDDSDLIALPVKEAALRALRDLAEATISVEFYAHQIVWRDWRVCTLAMMPYPFGEGYDGSEDDNPALPLILAYAKTGKGYEIQFHHSVENFAALLQRFGLFDGDHEALKQLEFRLTGVPVGRKGNGRPRLYATPEECKKVIEQALEEVGLIVPIDMGDLSMVTFDE